jgi:hypothetical protein
MRVRRRMRERATVSNAAWGPLLHACLLAMGLKGLAAPGLDPAASEAGWREGAAAAWREAG